MRTGLKVKPALIIIFIMVFIHAYFVRLLRLRYAVKLPAVKFAAIVYVFVGQIYKFGIFIIEFCFISAFCPDSVDTAAVAFVAVSISSR